MSIRDGITTSKVNCSGFLSKSCCGFQQILTSKINSSKNIMKGDKWSLRIKISFCRNVRLLPKPLVSLACWIIYNFNLSKMKSKIHLQKLIRLRMTKVFLVILTIFLAPDIRQLPNLRSHFLGLRFTLKSVYGQLVLLITFHHL
jgi:hypothetical protein